LAVAARFAPARGFEAPAFEARGLDVRGVFAAALVPASAFAAALLAALDGLPPESRFSLRFPGRERGRFPMTPSSSVMAGDSSRASPGYMEAVTQPIQSRRIQLVDWLVGGNSASGRLTSLSVALLCTSTV
jgi:hypothetical protein